MDSNGKDVVSVSNFVAQTPVVSVALTTSKDIECSVREIVVKCGQLSCPLFAGVKGGRSHNVSKNRRFTVIWFQFSINKNTTSTVICCRGLLRLCSAMRVCNNISFTANWVSIVDRPINQFTTYLKCSVSTGYD